MRYGLDLFTPAQFVFVRCALLAPVPTYTAQHMHTYLIAAIQTTLRWCLANAADAVYAAMSVSGWCTSPLELLPDAVILAT